MREFTRSFMIEYTTEGDLLTCGAQILVNPTNARGVMGRGLALIFEQRWPDMAHCGTRENLEFLVFLSKSAK
jgi:O-acetyl-ADP-ribose deacetylase (regulator of RNase III)